MPIDHAFPLRVDCHSRLSEDVLPITPLSVDPAAHNHTSIVLDPHGEPLLLAITPGAGVAEVRSPTPSAPGYSLRPLPDGARAREVVSLVDADGLVNAFYVTGSAVLHCVRDGHGEWGEPTELPPSTGLSVAEVPLAGTFTVSGIDARGDLALYTADGGKWAAGSVDVGGALLGGEARLAYTSPDAWVLFGAAGGVLRIWPGAEDRVAADPEVVKVAAPVARLVATYPHANSTMVVFTDEEHNLYSSAGFGDTPVRVPLGELVQGSAVVDGDGMVRCYGCAPDGRLWQLRQTAWAEDDTPVWAPIFPLDTDALQVRTPATGSGALVVTRADGTVDLLSRPSGGRWTRVAVHSEAEAAPTPVSRYRTRVTVTDANGLPCRDRTVELTPSRLVGLRSRGSTVIARPGMLTTFTTDETGGVEFSQPATGFDAITFTARVDGAAEALPITPHGYLYDTLAGRAPLFNGTTTIPPMSGDMLRAARVKDGPLAPGLGPDLAKVVASAVIQVARLGPGGAKPGGGFEMDLRDPEAPRFIHHDTADAVAGRLAELRRAAGHVVLTARGPVALATPGFAPPEALAAGILAKGLGDWLVDVWQALESGAAKLVNFIVHPDGQTASALVESAKGVWTAVEGLALVGLAEIGSLVQGVLNAIEVDFDKALDLFRDALHWNSIWRTMEVFYGLVTNGLSDLSGWIEKSAVVTTGRFFADLKSELGTGMDAAVAVLGNTTIGELADGRARLLPSRDRGRPAGLAAALPGDPSQLNYALSTLLDNLPGHALPAIPPLPDGLLGRLGKAVEDTGLLRDGARAMTDFGKLFTSIVHDPSKVGDIRVADLLAALRDAIDLAIDSCDVLAMALLESAREVVGGIRDFLTAPITANSVLTWFWDNVARPRGSREEMSLGRLLCLALAAPVTIACLAERGRGPFDPEKSRESLGKAVTTARLEVSQASLDTAEYYTCLALIGVDMINDTINMGEAAAKGGASGSGIPVYVNWFDIVTTVVVQALARPQTDWNWPAMSRGTKITNATWIGYWVPVAVDGLFTLFGKYIPQSFTVNAVVDTILGRLLIAAGVTGAVFQFQDHEAGATWLQIFEAATGPLPWVGQPLLVPEVVEVTAGVSSAAQIFVLDPLGDFDWEGPVKA
ncbi:hypothetical protein GCM10022226_43820 [Sphaerisporangium flaviroseum]|uniref:Uncharacterized protein n=1 Tax=Sphaerisporangium flaviroseum TaxID=509199 RepID=A0ABP7IHL9_9ACTN